MRSPARPLTTGLRALLAATVAAAGLTATVVAAPPASAATTVDGLTQATAAASCWEIKQLNGSAPSGQYWILTPQLKVPTRIYCDQTTDGGGWALIGRGRENWTYNYDGLGTPAEVAGTVSGTGAFAPRQLGAATVTALMGGKRIDDPTYGSGVRLRRATDQAGATWQESRWTFRSDSRDRWTWAFGAGLPLASFTIGGGSGAEATTRNVGTDDAFQRIWTAEDAANGYTRGFTYGSQVTGSTSASSYIYSKNAGGVYGVPFTQVYLRPKLMSSQLSFASVPNAGTAAETIRAAPRSGALATSWGVTGLGAGGTAETAGEVQAFAQIGGTVYVGGNFTTVQKGASASGSDVVSQPYLAAFDATTGDYLRSFTPRLDNQVKSLAALPNGKLAVGGEFTSVDGSARKGLVVLDPQSGALDASWTTNLVNKLTGGIVSVRGLDVGGSYLYLTGAFTHFTRPDGSERYAKGGARINLSTGVVDTAWNPDFNGTGTAVDASDDGSAVYFSGYFTTMRGGAAADRAAAISTASGAAKVADWQPTFSTAGSARYQQAVKQVGGKVWLGGSQHSMFSYDPSTFALENAHITKDGGDLQAITGGNGLVFGGCHCEQWNYSDTTQFDTTSPGSTSTTWSQADKIYYVGAWDARTGDYAPEFTPEMRARQGRGAWALMVASDGTLWAGGTMTSAVKENGANQWVGGFARFAVRPHTAPSRPSNLAVSVSGTTSQLTWSGSAPSGGTFEVLRNDRVIGLTTANQLSVAGASSGDRFAVRAADGWGNRSASTAVVGPPAGSVTTVPVVTAGSTWSYLVDNTVAVPSTWRTPTFDASGWRTGTAALGWGTGAIATNVDVPSGSTRPLTSYFRKQVTVRNAAALTSLVLTTRADDGIAVYVNGTEVGRSNLPAGTLTAGTYATSAQSTATATASPVSWDVPTSLIGSNGAVTIAVEVHSNYRLTPSMSMDLTLTGTS
ncbi:fibrinogen-like YCDxxxxGGGW domain-containing protein [Aeromicrobium sp. Root472D3]|uniref:fibrinogen-like YCDxxxxGGGW domain-containing protein n=1 Tax=Aeromicrobium sp. Root472D3 TaxID=1736540 RepID=UPI0006F316CC|nr:fibrinogen-like YCDxxxxGGGW domain-containing protein [Aeromicrobium sp. Root472D3]KQX71790.1 hypothetical protein ASD10_17655 [Aeromicrobium sp. Root472D3]